MKAFKNFFIGILLGGIIGWALGFLRIPYLEKNYSFLVGFISCLAVFVLFFILIIIRKKNLLLLKSLTKNSVEENQEKAVRKFFFIWMLVALMIFTGGLLITFLIYKQNEFFQTKTLEQNEKIRKESELMESVRRSKMLTLLKDVLDKVDDDLKNNAERKLSDKTIADLVQAFNYTFIPYRYFAGDSLSNKKLSPEKGQLILALFRRNIDSSSFNKIKLAAHFNGADLRKADLHGVDLSDADLRDADLSGADLNGSIFQGADLRNANFFGAHANHSNFSGADIRRATMSWAELNEAQMDSANMNGADLSNTLLRKADLHKAKLWTVKFDGALMNDANLSGAEMLYASLVKTNLTNANLTIANVFRTNLNESIMLETDLRGVFNFEKTWYDKLVGNKEIIGASEIKKKYKLVEYEAKQLTSRFRLEGNW